MPITTDKSYLATGKRNGAYREAARIAHRDLTVPDFAAVFPLADGGAFVECLVFVPEQAAEEAERRIK